MLGDLRCITTLFCSQSCMRASSQNVDMDKLLTIYLNDGTEFAKHGCLFYLYREKVMLVVVKAMKNPRSALCKTSIMASSDIFNAFGDKLLDATTDAFDNLVSSNLSDSTVFLSRSVQTQMCEICLCIHDK